MSEVKILSPTYFGVVVKVGVVGDARLICMVQEESRSLSIHFFQVDTTLDDSEYKVAVFRHRDFRSELRGTSLAVKLVDDSGPDEAHDVIARCLVDAYGEEAVLKINQIERPSILSLFV